MTNRPSDETTGKVVAKKAGWDKYNTTTAGRLHPLMVFHNGDMNAAQIPQVDPRDDTDAALELLGWIVSSQGFEIDQDWDSDETRQDGWVVYREKPYDMGYVHYTWLPFSGEPFRHAVVELAAKVLGVE